MGNFTVTNATMLVVGVAIAWAGTSPTVSSITYGGQEFLSGQNQSGALDDAEVWYLPNPTPGTAALTINYSGAVTRSNAGAISFANIYATIDPNLPNYVVNDAGLGTVEDAVVNDNTITTGNPLNITTTVDNCYVVAVIALRAGAGLTLSSAQTTFFISPTTGLANMAGGGSYFGPVHPAGVQGMTWTWTAANGESAQAALAFAPQVAYGQITGIKTITL